MYKFLYLFICIVCCLPVRARQYTLAGTSSLSDSIFQIENVNVFGYRGRDIVPSQTLNGERLQKLNSLNIADALRYFSGLQLKDYGGVGGIKTANIRSMGTHHLGIFYDGIQLGNAQNGQIDLGQFSMDNIEEVTLYNGQKSNVFQPASEFANAGSVYLRTRRPVFDDGRTFNLRAKVRFGSFDMVSTSVLAENRLSDHVRSSISAEFLNSSGKYDFRYRRKNADHSVAYDTTAVRQNGDIWAVRGEANLFGTYDSGEWQMKLYHYQSQRGIPGAIVNNIWSRGERQADRNTFVQGSITRHFGRLSSRLLAKYANYWTHYANRDTTRLMIDNTYRQQELFVSSSNRVELLPHLSASLSYDFKYEYLTSDVLLFVYPHRFSNFLSMATAYQSPHFNIQGSILSMWTKDHTRIGKSTPHTNMLTPALFINWYPLQDKWLNLRAFAKRSHRTPTFNDLYYTDMGNANLKPETALQYDLGILIDKSWSSGLLRHTRIQADAYYNSVKNKIVAYPKGQQFRWTMLNLGLVHIHGLDLLAEASVSPCQDLSVTGRVQYTYQKAVDVTSESDSYYNHQIPYIPWHSGSAIVQVDYRRWSLNYSFVYSGERYNQQENIVYNYMQPWYTNDLSLTYNFMIHNMKSRITLELNNLLSQDYDVILNYPMPKRNYRVSFGIEI